MTRKLLSKLTVWTFFLPSLFLSMMAYSFFPRWLRSPFIQITRWLLELRKNYVPSNSLSRPNLPTIPANADITYADELKPLEFEHFVGELLKTRGYSKVRVTPASGDHGVDVIAYKNRKWLAVQAKQYSVKVPPSAVREAFTGCKYYDCKVCMVVTNSVFTKSAKQEAQTVGCELVDRDTLKLWIHQYNLAQSSGFFNQVRLQFSKHPLLLTILPCLTLLILLFMLFEKPLCKAFC